MAKQSAPPASSAISNEPGYAAAEAALLAADRSSGNTAVATPAKKRGRPPKSQATETPSPAKSKSNREPEGDEPRVVKKQQRAKPKTDLEVAQDIKSRLLGPKPQPKATKPADDDEPEDEERDEIEDDDEAERPARRSASRRRDEEDEYEDDREGVSEDTLILAEESGLTHAELMDEIESLGSEQAVVAMLTRARRQARRMAIRADDEGEPRQRGDRRQTEQERQPVIPTAANEDDVDFEKEFALEGEWEDTAKELVTQLTKHTDPRFRALGKQVKSISTEFQALKEQMQRQQAMDQVRQLDKLYAEAGSQYAELFGKSSTRKLPAESTYAVNRDEHQNEMVAIQQSRSRRGLDLLEFDELFQAAAERLFPQLVERRIQEKNASERRSIRGTPQLRPTGRRSPLPQGREKAVETLERKLREYGRLE